MEILERAFKTIPGLALAFGIVGLFTLSLGSELSAALRLFVIAWIFYRIGSWLDRPVFDTLYDPPSLETETAWDRWRQRRLFRYRILEERREKAARALGLPGTAGLYKKATAALREAEVSDLKVYSSLQYSKAARTFILPLVVVSIAFFTSTWPWTRDPVPEFIRRGPLLQAFWSDILSACANLRSLTAVGTATLGALCIVIYIYFRVEHMTSLYELAAEPRPSVDRTVASEHLES